MWRSQTTNERMATSSAVPKRAAAQTDDAGGAPSRKNVGVVQIETKEG